MIAIFRYSKLLMCTQCRRQLLPAEAGFIIEAPGLVVGLHYPVLFIFDRFVIVIIGCQSEGNHETIVSCKFKVRIEICVSRANHDCCAAIVDQLFELNCSIEENGYCHNNTEANALPGALITSAIWKTEGKRCAKLVELLRPFRQSIAR